MEVVWKDNDGRWYQAQYTIPCREVVGKKQVYNINDIEDIDSYIHARKSSHGEIYIISVIQENIGTLDFYVKQESGPESPKKEWPCKTCSMLCKSDLVSACNYYKGPNGGDSWRV